jgi:SAM-dependent methyltransferase
MQAARALRASFDDWWKNEVWGAEPPEATQRRNAEMLAMLADRHYLRVLDVGCGDGSFTKLVTRIADAVVGIDVSSEAISRARSGAATTRVDFRVVDVMEYDMRAEGPWDLIVVTETIPYLGWLYPFFDVGWLAAEMYAVTHTGGRLLLVNTRAGVEDWLYRPWLIQTYRDLYRNVGYRLAHETVIEEPAGIEVLASLFERP